MVKQALRESLPPLRVEGEISNFVAHSSGHLYFSLKDAESQLRCVMFRRAARGLSFMPKDGMLCVATGAIDVYERSGQYQLIVERLEAAGEGALQIAFERLKRRLAEEGLFDPERKQKLPQFPQTIGIVTSDSGAALRDMVRVLRRRWPPIRIILRPAMVQGEGAAEDIARAIGEFETAEERVDLLIVGRGGGSLEDLWAFNEEIVARAISACSIPVVSAVGHEVDFTISDMVADLRAPTPSAAAELVVPDYREVLASAGLLVGRCESALRSKLERLKLRLSALEKSHAMQSPLERVRQSAQRADELLARIARSVGSLHRLLGERVSRLAERIEALGPQGVLRRGYALVLDRAGRPVRSVKGRRVGEQLSVALSDGALDVRVEAIQKGRGVEG